MKKSLSLIAMAGALVCLIGCTSPPPVAVVEPVGPSQVGSNTVVAGGRLQVYSATEEHQDGDNTYYHPHTDYCVCDASGRVVRRVRNHVGSMDEVPALVSLPAGTYQVRADGERTGRLTVPVVVRAGETTVLHLDDGWRLPANCAESKLVRLPDGEAIGWRASANGVSGNQE